MDFGSTNNQALGQMNPGLTNNGPNQALGQMDPGLQAQGQMDPGLPNPLIQNVQAPANTAAFPVLSEIAQETKPMQVLMAAVLNQTKGLQQVMDKMSNPTLSTASWSSSGESW